MATEGLTDMGVPPLRAVSLGGGRILAYPAASTAAARRVMQGNRSTGTRPEAALRSALHRRGLRFRKNLGIETDIRRIRADIVFPTQRLAVFVDGCFWHCCPQHGSTPRSNQEYWRAKLERNRSRDIATNEALRRAGWHVCRVWEHEPVSAAASVIEQRVRQHGA